MTKWQYIILGAFFGALAEAAALEPSVGIDVKTDDQHSAEFCGRVEPGEAPEEISKPCPFVPRLLNSKSPAISRISKKFADAADQGILFDTPVLLKAAPAAGDSASQEDKSATWRLGYQRTFGPGGNNYFLRMPYKGPLYVQGYVPRVSVSREGRQIQELEMQTVQRWLGGRVDRVVYHEVPALRIYPITQIGLEIPFVRDGPLSLFGGLDIGLSKYDGRQKTVQEYLRYGLIGPPDSLDKKTLEQEPGRAYKGLHSALVAGAVYALKPWLGIMGDYSRILTGPASQLNKSQVRIGATFNFNATKLGDLF